MRRDAPIGRPSIPPEKLLRALRLQALYPVRSERQLMAQMEYNLLFPWFPRVGPKGPEDINTGHVPDRVLDAEAGACPRAGSAEAVGTATG